MTAIWIKNYEVPVVEVEVFDTGSSEALHLSHLSVVSIAILRSEMTMPHLKTGLQGIHTSKEGTGW